MVMVTDPARVRRNDPGDPEKCSVWSYHKVFTDPSRHAEIDTGCRTAGIGCRDCKKILADALNEKFAPVREKRAELEAAGDQWRDILMEGSDRARARAAATMERVRGKLNLWQ
jgi:tryptophanyl-tRNA synthetase